jgi:hypothetical protein
MNKHLAMVCVFGLALCNLAAAVERSPTGEYVLTDFGDTSKAKAAQETLEQACQWIIANGGGVLIVPPAVAVPLEVKNTYQKERDSGPTVTIRDLRKGYETRHLPTIGQLNSDCGGWAGQHLNRLINMKGHGLPFSGSHQMSQSYNAVVRGAASYMQMTTRDVKQGTDCRIDVPSIRGIFVGEYLTLTGKAAAYAEPYDRLWVKGIGWDPAEKVNYVIADLKYDHPAGAILYSKHVTGSVDMDSTANCDNQTMEFQVTRRQYAHGDSFLISGKYEYQGDVFSGLGDERGVVLNAEVTTDPEVFHAVVESTDWKDDAIVIKPGKCAIQKIATSRAIINLNSKKWLTAGTVLIVPPEDWGGFTVPNKEYDPVKVSADGIDVSAFKFTYRDGAEEKPSLVDCYGQPVKAFKYIYKGRAYPSIIVKWTNTLGGCIVGSADCGWSDAVIGRYFAVDSPGEVLSPGDGSAGIFYAGSFNRPVRRWYLIKKYWKNQDGTHSIKIERIRWAASNAGAPNLYDFENYTWDGHERPLNYVIAPGAFAYDIGDAWKDTVSGAVTKNDPRTLRVVPNADRDTEFGFAADDPIEQAIGADPAIPVPVRVRCFNGVPDTMEAAGVDLINNGKVAMHSGLAVVGGCNNRDDIQKRKDKKAPWLTAVTVGAATENAIVFGADVTNAALLFSQINEHEQPIKWKHGKGETSLVVDPKSGDMSIKGSSLTIAAAKGVNGLSGTAVAANNLRGINVPVPVGGQEAKVVFPTPEIDANYAINLTCSWLTRYAVRNKTAAGFTVVFDATVKDGESFDWFLIR